jgi:hypothetical protein
MRRHSRYFLGCAGAAFAAASFLIGLEMTATTAALSADRNVPAVNRTLKSDRLPLVAPKSRNAVNGPLEQVTPPAPKPKLPDGCEPVVSSIGQSPLAQIAGRCVS